MKLFKASFKKEQEKLTSSNLTTSLRYSELPLDYSVTLQDYSYTVPPPLDQLSSLLSLETSFFPQLSTFNNMPRSRRDKVVALTEVKKKGKQVKSALIDSVRESADQFSYIWVFQVEHMRNNLLQEVRTAWKGSRIFLGRNAVMRKGLGSTKEDECRLGVSKIANVRVPSLFHSVYQTALIDQNFVGRCWKVTEDYYSRMNHHK